ncbi:MAG: AgmX/PglI C-terminal domain-containing protein [Bdellovibrionales bacterium]|nr:AgmX/PglI C-terminal domain-containing protein [Bdellovibrionales bacterium]
MYKAIIGFAVLFLSVGCTTPPVKTVKDPKCRTEIYSLQAKENAGTKITEDAGLRSEEVALTIEKHMPQVRRCYETSKLGQSYNEKRAIQFGFLVRKDGSVGRTCVEETQTDDIELQACLTQILRTAHFPFPRGGSAVAISFPFTFETHSR